MAANTEPVFVLGGLTPAANTQIGNTIVNADGTTAKDIITGATDGTLVQDIIAVSDDTAAMEANIFFYDGATAFKIGSVAIPAGSGDSGSAASVSLLNATNIPSLNKRDDGAILLASGQKLQVGVTAAVTAAKTVTLLTLGGNL